MRLQLRNVLYKGLRLRVPPLKPISVRGRKVLVPLKKGEPPTLDVMPYWDRRIDKGGKTATIKRSTFRIPIRGIKRTTIRPQVIPPKKQYTQPVKRSVVSAPIARPQVVIRPPIKERGVTVKSKNQVKFIAWTKKTFPRLYHAALLDIKQKKGLGGIGDFFGDLVGSLKDLAPSYLQFKQQKDLMKMQLKRAQSGLPPADVKDYTPVIKTQIDLAPETRRAVVNQTANLIKPLMIGGGVLLGIMALKRLG